MVIRIMTFQDLKHTIFIFLKAIWLDISEKRLIGTASNLTYSTLLSFVPIMAVVFAIARGFGYSIYIEEWFKNSLSSQPEAAETIIGFVNSYLIHTQKGIFLGVGLLFMLWTVLMLITNIETAFNDIWQVKHQRSIFRTSTDYLALMFLIPIGIVISSGLSICITAFNHQVKDLLVIGPIMQIVIEIAPYIFLSLAFTCLYIFMPNTKVRFRSALLPGILAGVSMQLFQLIYINSQIWISNYNAVYGSFAMIPFFLLFIQTSWIICLVGAELSYCRQNSEDFFAERQMRLSFNSRIEYSWQIMEIVSERFTEGGEALTAHEIKIRIGIPMRILTTLLYDLQRIHFLAELVHDDKGDTARYLPSEALKNLTKEELVKRLSQIEN